MERLSSTLCARAALAIALAGALFVPFASARAQITYTFQTYGDRGPPASGATNYLVNWPLSRAECEANEPITMVVTNAPYDGTGMNRRVWDLWQGGTGTMGANCQTAMNRRAVSGMEPVCRHRSGWVGGEITSAMMTLRFRPQELFPSGCTASTQGTFVFYLLAVSASGDTTTDVPAAEFTSFSVALDFIAPEAPMLEDAAGDRRITVEWTNSTTEMLSGARVYVDRTAACGESTVLQAGRPAPAGLSPAATVTGSSPRSATLDGEALGLEVGQGRPMAVTVLDLARNESVLSNVACIERVPVEGFWDAYCRERGLSAAACRERYSGCSASRGRPSIRPAWTAAALGLLVVVLGMRRRVGTKR